MPCVRCVAPPLAFGDGWSGRSDLARRPPAAACCPAAPCGATLLFLLDLTTWKSAFGSFLPNCWPPLGSIFCCRLSICFGVCRFAAAASTTSAATRRVEVSLLTKKKNFHPMHDARPPHSHSTLPLRCVPVQLHARQQPLYIPGVWRATGGRGSARMRVFSLAIHINYI